MIVTITWLKEHLHDPQIRVIDCRFLLNDPTYGKKQYLTEHVPGAAFLDLEKDLSGPIDQHGGRHPLPDPNQLSDKLGKMGVDQHTKVIVYDENGGFYAGRAWWLLTYLGHTDVHVLEQGWQGWTDEQLPTEQSIPRFGECTFIPQIQSEMIASRAEVLQKLGSSTTTILDSREAARYHGITEPIDPIAGHIPHAVNYFWGEVLDEEHQWKDKDTLQKHYANISHDQEVIVYCGSGVSATPNIMGLYRAGYQNIKLYPGSWSDWVSYKDAPIARIDQTSQKTRLD